MNMRKSHMTAISRRGETGNNMFSIASVLEDDSQKIQETKILTNIFKLLFECSCHLHGSCFCRASNEEK